MIEFYHKVVSFWNGDNVPDFELGYWTGTVVALVFLILVVVLRFLIFKRNKKVHEVRIPGEGGSLFVASGAIGDMVKFVGATFEYIEISKVSLRESKYGIVMDINVSYDMHGERFPELANELKTSIRGNLEGQLGIDSIKDINIHDKKITDTKNSRF